MDCVGIFATIVNSHFIPFPCNIFPIPMEKQKCRIIPDVNLQSSCICCYFIHSFNWHLSSPK